MNNHKDIDQIKIKALYEQVEAFKKELEAQQKELQELRKDAKEHNAMFHEEHVY